MDAAPILETVRAFDWVINQGLVSAGALGRMLARIESICRHITGGHPCVRSCSVHESYFHAHQEWSAREIEEAHRACESLVLYTSSHRTQRLPNDMGTTRRWQSNAVTTYLLANAQKESMMPFTRNTTWGRQFSPRWPVVCSPARYVLGRAHDAKPTLPIVQRRCYS